MQRAYTYFSMQRDCGFWGTLLHDYVAAALANLGETMLPQKRQSALPENTRSLPNRDLKARHEDFRMHAGFNFFGIRSLEKQFDCFGQIGFGIFNRSTLTCYIQFRAKRNIASAFPFDQSSQLMRCFHEAAREQWGQVLQSNIFLTRLPSWQDH